MRPCLVPNIAYTYPCSFVPLTGLIVIDDLPSVTNDMTPSAVARGPKRRETEVLSVSRICKVVPACARDRLAAHFALSSLLSQPPANFSHSLFFFIDPPRRL